MTRIAKIVAMASALAAGFALPVLCRAQGTDPNFVAGKEQQQQQDQALKERAMSQQNNSQAAKVDPKQSKAYKAFYDTSPQDLDKRIQLGEDFVKQYPSGPYTGSVYVGLVQAYYMKQDLKSMYASADKALAIKPGDVDVLVLVGWVIPHVYNPAEPDASQKLDKAQSYETKAIQEIATLPKPADMTDEQFTAGKAQKLAEAHSGLGLVYFRRQDFGMAAEELRQATQGNPTPDPSDYFALGAALQNTRQFSQAAEAFDRCAQIPGSLQNQCKQYEESARKLAAQGK